MLVTFLGHAGMLLETHAGSILCDPWFTPAYFASWFPFPANDGIDPALLATPAYLYVSHLHRDHFDPALLREHVHRDAVVILPDFPVDHLRRSLEELGFTRFVETRSGVPQELAPGLTVAVIAMGAPTDGPLGDSALIIDDGSARIINQNDSRPVDIDELIALGPYDAHFLQYSGAIWYPMVYRMNERAKRALGERKRANQLSRALRYVEQLNARAVFPSAGPPCFLDDALYAFNDFDGDPANIFPDQTVFIEHLRATGRDNGVLLLPGSVATVERGAPCTVTHPLPDEEVQRIFTDKRAYLDDYARRMRPRIAAELAALPRGRVDITAALTEWFTPLLLQADMLCAGVAGRVVLDHGDGAVTVDFERREVRDGHDPDWDYRFFLERGLLEAVIERHDEDWVNGLFLSCRFEAERKGGFNEHVYNFFKCLSPERLQYLEGYYSERDAPNQLWECDGYLVQTRCPHLKADLRRFAEVHDGVLTCTMHGWQFDLATGRCLTSDDRRIVSIPSRPLTRDGERCAAQADAGKEAPST